MHLVDVLVHQILLSKGLVTVFAVVNVGVWKVHVLNVVENVALFIEGHAANRTGKEGDLPFLLAGHKVTGKIWPVTAL